MPCAKERKSLLLLFQKADWADNRKYVRIMPLRGLRRTMKNDVLFVIFRFAIFEALPFAQKTCGFEPGLLILIPQIHSKVTAADIHGLFLSRFFGTRYFEDCRLGNFSVDL